MAGGGGMIAWDQAEGNPGGITAQSLGKQGLERLNTAPAVCPTMPRTNSAGEQGTARGTNRQDWGKGDKTLHSAPWDL